MTVVYPSDEYFPDFSDYYSLSVADRPYDDEEYPYDVRESGHDGIYWGLHPEEYEPITSEMDCN